MRLLPLALLLCLTIHSQAQTFHHIFKSTAFDRDIEDRYGWDVDISGNFAVIGAYADDFGSNNPNMGSAYIYEKTAPGTWTFVQKIINSDQDDYDRFGYSVAIDGNTIAIGAHNEEHDAAGLNHIHHAGSVYLFERDMSGVWNQTQKVVHADRSPDINWPNGYPNGEDQSDQFGNSVGISGDYMVVGAHMEDRNENGGVVRWNAGAAYFFERDAGGVWQQVQKVVNYDRRPWDRFGWAVAIDTNWAIIGCFTQDSLAPSGYDGLMNPGAAYMYQRDAAGTWNSFQKIVADDRNSGDHFGYSVDISNGFAVIGSEQDNHDENDSDALNDAGSAYVFQYDGTSWSQLQKLAAEHREVEDYFGISCGISEDDIVVGSYQHDLDADSLNNIEDAGAAIFFTNDICLFPILHSQSFDECFGFSLNVGSNTYSTTGIYIDTLVAANGCDSIVTTDLMVGADLSSSANVFRCFGESYSIGTSTHTATGVYMDTLIGSTGCDSIITTTLTIGPDLSASQTIEVCFGDTYSIGTNTYNTSGTYMDTLIGTDGCDSIVTTNFTVAPLIVGSQNVSVCFGDTYSIGTSTYSASGTYMDTLTAINGCDSVVTTNLTVDPLIVGTQNVSVCFGTTYSIGTNTYNASGTYMDTLTAINGCDSVVTTNLTVDPLIVGSQSVTICFGDSYTVGSNMYTTAGTYVDTLISIAGCDSILSTNLSVEPAINTQISASNNNLMAVATADSYQWVDCDNFYQHLSGQINASFVAQLPGNYAVIMTVGSCSDTSTCQQVVNFDSVDDLALGNWNIYPNPSNGSIHLQLMNGEKAELSVVNSVGQIAYQTNINSTRTDLDLSFLPKGLYTVHIVMDGTRSSRKLILQ